MNEATDLAALILLSPMIILIVAVNLAITETIKYLWKLGQRAVLRITVLISTV